MADFFSHSDDLVDEVTRSDVAQIDATRPGFASLLPLMRQALHGEADVAVLEAYHAGLSAHVADARRQFDTLTVPAELREQAAPFLQTTEYVLTRMAEIVSLLGAHLETADAEPLETAVARLEEIRDDISGMKGWGR